MGANSGTDFVWRFRLHEEAYQPVFEDALLEWLRVQWELLLGLCVPYSGGEPVQLDGFATMRDPETIHKIFHDASA